VVGSAVVTSRSLREIFGGFKDQIRLGDTCGNAAVFSAVFLLTVFVCHSVHMSTFEKLSFICSNSSKLYKVAVYHQLHYHNSTE